MRMISHRVIQFGYFFSAEEVKIVIRYVTELLSEMEEKRKLDFLVLQDQIKCIGRRATWGYQSQGLPLASNIPREFRSEK